MNLETDSQENCLIVRLSGNLLDESSHEKVLNTLQEHIDEGQSHIILDLKGIEYMNSTGLGLLVRTLSRARKVGGEVVLAHVSEELSKLLVMTKLNAVFNIFESVEEACQKFSTSNE